MRGNRVLPNGVIAGSSPATANQVLTEASVPRVTRIAPKKVKMAACAALVPLGAPELTMTRWAKVPKTENPAICLIVSVPPHEAEIHRTYSKQSACADAGSNRVALGAPAGAP